MTRHRFLLVVLVVLVAGLGTACSSTASTAPVTPGSPARPGGGATAQHTVYPLTVTQPDGTTAVVKAAPKRIVTVGNPSISMDNVMALGVKPVGGEVPNVAANPAAYDAYDSRGIPKEVADQITSFTPVGSPTTSPDLETVASLHPDLIVGVNGASTTDLAQLKAIAPVISPGNTFAPGNGIDSLSCVNQVQLLGKILDRQAQANAFVAKFAAAAAGVRKAVAGKTVDLVTPSPQGNTFFWFGADAQPTGHFLSVLGLDLVTSFPEGGKFVINGDYNFSMERVGVLNAQYLVLGIQPSLYASFLANPLVQQLPSVKAGRVIRTKGSSMGFGDGYLVAGAIGQLKALAGIQQAFTTTGAPR